MFLQTKYIVGGALVGAVAYGGYDVWRQRNELKEAALPFRRHYSPKRTMQKAGKGLAAGVTTGMTIHKWVRDKEHSAIEIAERLLHKAVDHYLEVRALPSPTPSDPKSFELDFLGV